MFLIALAIITAAALVAQIGFIIKHRRMRGDS
jgi:hypothetical protein